MPKLNGAQHLIASSQPLRRGGAMKVNPFHTTTREEGAGHRDVYYDNNQCSDGKRIKPEHKVSGTGGRPKCDECEGLS
jgi:hypothetical protein